MSDARAHWEYQFGVGFVVQFERDLPVEAGVDEPGGMHDESLPGYRAFAFQPCDDPRGDMHGFQRAGEEEFMRAYAYLLHVLVGFPFAFRWSRDVAWFR